MLIERPILNPYTTTYKGSLSKYHYASSEFDNLLDFLREVTNPDEVYLIDSLDFNYEMPPQNFESYIVGFFGEFGNLQFLKEIEQHLPNKKLICLSSQYILDGYLEHFQVYQIEHIHKLFRYFPRKDTVSLKDRNNLHSILSRRTEVQRVLFIAALLSYYDKVIYSFVNFFANADLEKDFVKFLKNYHNYELRDLSIRQKVQKVLTEPAKVLQGHQWSINNLAYQDVLLHWVNESVFTSSDNEPLAYITEKTIKPIVSGTPFVVLGQPYVYERLESLGINTYRDIFEIDFDVNISSAERIEKILELMSKCSKEFLYDNVNELQNIADYNIDYFYNGLSEHCENKNSHNYQKILEYING